MTARALSKLQSVLKYPFFQSAGSPLPATVVSVPSWPIAMKEYNSKKWENCCLSARNALQTLTEKKSWARSEEWNSVVEELRPSIVSFVDGLLPRSPVPEKFINEAKPQLCWDIMFMCMEYHYADIVDPIFYLPLLDPWYAVGRVPCGWEGKEFSGVWDGIIPVGKLMVF